MSKVLITGVAGFIGARLANKLISENYEIIGIDNFDSNLYSCAEKKKRVAQLQKFKNFEFIEQSILNINELKEISEIEMIYHLAALPGQTLSWNKAQLYFEVNTAGTYEMLNFAQQNEINKFVFFSTSSVYGNKAIGNERTEKNPISPYGISKLAAEQIVSTFQSGKIQTVIIRPFSVYGPGQRPDMAISKFLNAINNEEIIHIYGDGEQIRDCTFVDDLVDLNISLLNNWQMNETFNVSGGVSVTLNEIIEICEQVVGKTAKKIFEPKQRGDQQITKADCLKAKNLLNYKPSTSIFDGIERQYLQMLNK